MNNQMGFGIFGNLSQLPIIAEEKSTGTQKKQDTTGTYETRYKMPKKFLFDSLPSVPCEVDGTFTKKEVLEWLAKKTGLDLFSEHSSCFNLEKLGDTFLIRPTPSTAIEKGGSGKYLLLHSLINLNDIFELNDTGETNCKDVKNYIEDTYGINIKLYQTGSTYVPVPYGTSKGSLTNLKFPINASALSSSGEILEITEQDYISFLTADKAQDKYTISDTIIREVLSALFPDYAMDLQYSINEERSLIYVFHKYQKSAAPASASKEEMYPATALVSLIFTQIQLSPDMFNGKKELTKKEIIRHIGKDYPEYSMERTELQFDKKKNMIIPVLKSGKRGCESKYYLDDNKIYRLEQSPLMDIFVIKDSPISIGCSDGSVQLKIPKIPFYILKQVIYFFWDVFIYLRTEAIAQIFFSPKNQCFQIYIPEQEVTETSVEFYRNFNLELSEDNILVMEIHSHGMYKATWSMTDNAEELRHCLYAVIGDLPNFYFDRNHIRVRGASGGYFVEMEPEHIFHFPKCAEEFNMMFSIVKKIQ